MSHRPVFRTSSLVAAVLGLPYRSQPRLPPLVAVGLQEQIEKAKERVQRQDEFSRVRDSRPSAVEFTMGHQQKDSAYRGGNADDGDQTKRGLGA